jgi:hypothetical protein
MENGISIFFQSAPAVAVTSADFVHGSAPFSTTKVTAPVPFGGLVVRIQKLASTVSFLFTGFVWKHRTRESQGFADVAAVLM